MTFEEAYSYITDAYKKGSVFGLAAVKGLLEILGNPQDKLKVIHVAGTNGKGSICTFLEGAFRAGGFSVGRYISPTVFTYLERFQANGEVMREDEFADIMSRVALAVDEMVESCHDAPSAFDMETAVSFLYFLEKDVDVVILETGLGGAMDSTNVVAKPICIVLASIGFDHMDVLGKTLPEILKQKMGIMREGVPCVAYPMETELRAIWEDECGRLGSAGIMVHEDDIEPLKIGLDGTTFSYKGREVSINVLGLHQMTNAAVAIEVADAVSGIFGLTDEQILTGVASVTWPGRFEKINDNPLVFVDGAHNQAGWSALAENIKTYFEDKSLIYICGVFKDKEYGKLVELTGELASDVICVTPPGTRGLPAELLAEAFSVHGRGCGLADEELIRGRSLNICASKGLDQVQTNCMANELYLGIHIASSLCDAKSHAHTLASNYQNPVIIAFGSLSFLGDFTRLYK